MSQTKRIGGAYTITASGGTTIDSALVVTGNLTVSGTTTTVSTTNAAIKDNIVVYNDGESGAGVSGGAGKSGIEIDRGSVANAQFVFDEADDTISALALMKDKPWDLIFLDHDLGGQVFVSSSHHNTGYTVAKYIEEHRDDLEIKQIKNIWDEFVSDYPFEYFFFDDHLKEMYEAAQDKETGLVFGNGGDFGLGSFDLFLINVK